MRTCLRVVFPKEARDWLSLTSLGNSLSFCVPKWARANLKFSLESKSKTFSKPNFRFCIHQCYKWKKPEVISGRGQHVGSCYLGGGMRIEQQAKYILLWLVSIAAHQTGWEQRLSGHSKNTNIRIWYPYHTLLTEYQHSIDVL